MYSTKPKKINPAIDNPKKAFGGLLEKVPDMHAKGLKPEVIQISMSSMDTAQVKKGVRGFLRSRLPEIHAFASAMISVALFIYVFAVNPMTHFAVAKISGSTSMQEAVLASSGPTALGEPAMDSNPGPTTKPSKDKKKKDPDPNTTMS